MKRIGNKNLKIAAATMMTIFSLFVTFSGVFAWFVSARSSTEESGNMVIENMSGLLKSITVHNLLLDQYGEPTEDAFIYSEPTETTPALLIGHVFDISETNMSSMTMRWAESGTTQFAGSTRMGQYKLLEQSKPVLLLFHFNEKVPANSVIIKASSNSDSSAYFDSDEEDRTPLEATGNPLSAITQFSSVAFEEDVTPKTPAEVSEDSSCLQYPVYLHNSGVEDVVKTSEPITFTEMNSSGVFSDYHQNRTFFSSESETKIECVGIVMDYYSPAIDFLYYLNLGNDAVTGEGVLFDCDWTMVV